MQRSVLKESMCSKCYHHVMDFCRDVHTEVSQQRISFLEFSILLIKAVRIATLKLKRCLKG